MEKQEVKRMNKPIKAFLKMLSLAGLLLLFAINTGCSDKKDEAVIYTVEFRANGGQPVPATQRIKAGEIVQAPSENPSKVGYVFMFWYKEGAISAYNFQTPVNEDFSLSAAWKEEAAAEFWQVSWELNGGAWPTGDNHASKVVKGGTLAEPLAPVKVKSVFDGWYSDAALSKPIAFPYDVSKATTDIKLYAKWKDEAVEPQKGIVMIASGRYSYFVLNADGRLEAVGRNSSGHLGTGNNKDVKDLVQVAVDVASVYTSGSSTFIIKKDGTVWGVGENGDGALGLGNTDSQTSFTLLSGMAAEKIDLGGSFTMLIKKDASLWATGFNAYGQLGVSDTKRRESFTATNLTSDVIAVSAGYDHSLALKKDGTVWGAGYGYVGALGEKALGAEVSSFVQIASDVKAIAAGENHSLLLKNDGTVYASGLNENGALGLGHIKETKVFSQSVEASGTSLKDVTALAAGNGSSYALKADGTLWAAGLNNYGQLGTGDEEDRTSFIQVASSVKSMSAGRYHCVVVTKDDKVKAYGVVNPYEALDGSGTILIKVNDPNYFEYITNGYFYDRNSTLLLNIDKILQGDSGKKISVKPGKYRIRLHASNQTAPYIIEDLSVGDKQTVTISYEYEKVGVVGSYKWKVEHSK